MNPVNSNHRHSKSAGRVCHGCGSSLPPTTWQGRNRKWCSERCRKLTLYSRQCVDCGTTINTDGRVKDAAERCVQCAAIAAGAERKVWTREAIVDAIQRWAALYGEPPRTTNWNPTKANEIGKRHLAAVYRAREAGEWPSHNAVFRAFGSWNAAVEAAGFKSRPANHAGKEAA